MNKKVIKLENNKEYFIINELIENNIKYILVMNVDNESDVKIVKQITDNNEEYIIDVKDEALLNDLKQKFKSLVDQEKNNYA